MGNDPASARSVQLGPIPVSAALPVVSQITGTLFFPAVATPTTLQLSASVSAPAGVALESAMRTRQQSGTLTVYEYFSLVPATSVTLPNIPAVTLTFPSSIPLAGKSFFYGISDLSSRGGLVSFDTQGPGTIRHQSVSFALVPTPITFVSGHKYTFVVYSTAPAAQTGAKKIYVAGEDDTVKTYEADGTRTTPTIDYGLNGVRGVAVDGTGKIYITNVHIGAVLIFNADGTRTTSRIDGLYIPQGLAVGANGKIYVTNIGNNIVTTYNPDGSQTTPTLSEGLNLPIAVAVDVAGKIYVTNPGNNTVTTYNADGSRATPTIGAGLDQPFGIAVDATGKIYVTNGGNNTVTTYNADGTRSSPTITAAAGLNYPTGVAVDMAGKIFVVNYGNATVTTYDAHGSRMTPTITGLNSPREIALQ